MPQPQEAGKDRNGFAPYISGSCAILMTCCLRLSETDFGLLDYRTGK
jgi:hypothetical protein